MTEAERRGLDQLRAEFPDHHVTLGQWGEAVITPLTAEQLRERALGVKLGAKARAAALVFEQLDRDAFEAAQHQGTV